MKKLLMLSLLCILSLAGCSSKKDDVLKPCDAEDGNCVSDIESAKDIDMSAYEGFDDKEHAYKEISLKDSLDIIKDKKSAVVYYGFPKCPWCIEIVPILNEVAKENKITVYYVNTRLEENMDETQKGELVEILKDYLETNDEGNPHLYVPDVYVFKDGKVLDHHLGTVDGHDAHERKITDEEKQQVKETYQKMIEKLK